MSDQRPMTAAELVAEFERAVIEAQHVLANAANEHYVERLREVLVRRLDGGVP